MIEALKIQVRGIVQGVGFRPFIYRLAKKYLINGWVLNAADGVFIHAEGETKLLDEFVIEISSDPPAASQVDEIELKEVPLEDFTSFEIRYSDESAVEKTTLISPDLATCSDCEKELFNPNDRRYRYPFINCTNCGPRFTIINELPYDRDKTSMKSFPMCERCQEEYEEPLDRRFHAQPDACFECGPHISWRRAHTEPEDIRWGSTRDESDAILGLAVDALRQGEILAVKGLGGFHLVCDATNEAALAELRRRKRRKGQAFAVMMPDISMVREFCEVNPVEESLLTGAQRPIVLLKKARRKEFAAGLADGLNELGVMLAYTPLQHLLLHDFGGMLVMTSANIHDEPIVTDDEEAYAVLSEVADAFIGHSRAIETRYDDSVVRVLKIEKDEFSIQFIRRARGYAPTPLALPAEVDTESSVFATGPEQKNTFCLTRGQEAFVSQHIGDMENKETYDAWLEISARYKQVFKVEPKLLACDMHPEYLTSKWAQEQTLPLVKVQHHHAHTVSVMAENKIESPVLGIAFDGTGYGVDGRIWGGEVLLSNYQTFERFANFVYVPMPGGSAAIKHPLRMAYGVLWAFDLLEHPAAAPVLEELGHAADMCAQMIERNLNTPYTSSVGRLFDAASAILGICTEARYEGEGAILLEASIQQNEAADKWDTEESPVDNGHSTSGGEKSPADTGHSTSGGEDSSEYFQESPYEVEIIKNTATSESTAQDTSILLLDAAPMFKALLDDREAGVATSLIAKRFHDGIITAILEIGQAGRMMYEIETLALSGGVFMNRYLSENVLRLLTREGFTVAVNRELPPGDGCISFGQAVVALAQNNEQ